VVVCRPGSGKSQIQRLLADSFTPALGKRAVTSGTVPALLQTLKAISEGKPASSGAGDSSAKDSGITGASVACIIPEYNGYEHFVPVGVFFGDNNSVRRLSKQPICVGNSLRPLAPPYVANLTHLVEMPRCLCPSHAYQMRSISLATLPGFLGDSYLTALAVTLEVPLQLGVPCHPLTAQSSLTFLMATRRSAESTRIRRSVYAFQASTCVCWHSAPREPSQRVRILISLRQLYELFTGTITAVLLLGFLFTTARPALPPTIWHNMML
jgi:hypothetical protein